MSLPSNKHITVWLQLPWSPALTATVSTTPLHRSPNPSLPLSSTPDQPSNKSNSMSENSVVRTDNLSSPGSGEITRCQTRKGEVVRHCKELVHSGFVQHLQHHAHSSSTWKRETFTSYFLCITCNPKNLRVLWPFSFLCTISYTYDPSSNPITLYLSEQTMTHHDYLLCLPIFVSSTFHCLLTVLLGRLSFTINTTLIPVYNFSLFLLSIVTSESQDPQKP